MDKLKYVKLEQEDGSYSSSIPLAVDSDYVDINGSILTTQFNKKPYYFNTVADMKNATNLINGDMVITLGYYTINDGGTGLYKITNSSSSTSIALKNSLYAELIIEDGLINIKSLGAKADGQTNIGPYLELAKNYSGTIYIPAGTYKLTSTINLNWGNKIMGNIGGNSIIIYDGQTCFVTVSRNDIRNLNFKCSYNDPASVTEIRVADPIINGTNGYAKIENINIGNAFIGIKQAAEGPISIEHIEGIPLKWGIYIHDGIDVCHIHNVHFNPNYYGVPTINYREYCFENSYAFHIGRQDFANITDSFIWGCKGLVYLTAGDTRTGSANNIIFKNCAVDACACLASFIHFDGNIEFDGGCGTFYNPYYSEAEAAGLTPQNADTYVVSLSNPIADSDGSASRWVKISNMYFYRGDYNFALVQAGAQLTLVNNYFKGFHTKSGISNVAPVIYAGGRCIIDGNFIKASDWNTYGEKQGILNNSSQNIITNNRIWGYNQPISKLVDSDYIQNNNVEKVMYEE